MPQDSAEALAAYRAAKSDPNTHPERVQSLWMAYTAAVEAEMKEKEARCET